MATNLPPTNPPPSQNECKCPKPPGGVVKCSPDQAAICHVDEEGNLQGACMDVPAAAMSAAIHRDDNQLVKTLTPELSAALNIPEPRLYEAAWNIQHEEERTLISILLRVLRKATPSRINMTLRKPIMANASYVTSKRSIFKNIDVLERPAEKKQHYNQE